MESPAFGLIVAAYLLYEALVVLRVVLEAPIVSLDVVPFELQYRLGVGIESGDSRGHAAGEGGPGHAARDTEEAHAVKSHVGYGTL